MYVTIHYHTPLSWKYFQGFKEHTIATFVIGNKETGIRNSFTRRCRVDCVNILHHPVATETTVEYSVSSKVPQGIVLHKCAVKL